MPEFNFPVDIGQRALMRCGSGLMGAAGLAEISKRASLINACYGKLRRAELQDNVWRFATKKAPLRALDTTTMLLAPTLWSASVTYFVGCIVIDANNTAWVSKIRNNLNNQPGQAFSAWDPYFGPMTAALYDSGKNFFAGEVVYTAAGDGTYNVFLSVLTGNSVHPALPNQWASTTTYYKNNVVQVFPAWSSLTTYSQGQSIKYTDGNVYSSLTNSNLNNVPTASPSNWALMPTLVLQSALSPSASNPPPTLPGTTPIDEWNIEQAYSIGNFVIFNAAVYLSIANTNTGNLPNAAGSSSWVACTGGTSWMSLTDLNFANNPTSTPAAWSSVTTYSTGQVVAATDGINYTSKVNGNLNLNPANGANAADWTQGSFTAWTSTFVGGLGNQQWMQVGGAAFPNGVGLAGLNIPWPLQSGPASDSTTRNAYRLPAGYLRRAPQDASAGRSSFLGAPNNLPMNDWEFDSDYLVSNDSGVIILRFTADFQDVAKMPDMFCEGLACRIAEEVCEPLTQSTAKLGAITNAYKFFLGKAKLANAIDMEADEPPLDELIACRY